MKLKGFTPLEVKKEQFLFMKRLTYIIHPLHHGHVTHSLKVSYPKNAQKSAIDSIANIDDHNMIGFARETNSTFAPW